MKVKIKVYDIAVDQGRLIGILRRMWVEEESGETERGNDVRSRTVTTFLWAPYLALTPQSHTVAPSVSQVRRHGYLNDLPAEQRSPTLQASGSLKSLLHSSITWRLVTAR